MRWHPDRNKSLDADARFKEINYAYSVLSDPKKRANYDEGLASSDSDRAFSDEEAARIFLEEMFDLAYRLADAGHDENFIFRAMTEQGCPSTIAAAASRSACKATQEMNTNRGEKLKQSAPQQFGGWPFPTGVRMDRTENVQSCAEATISSNMSAPIEDRYSLSFLSLTWFGFWAAAYVMQALGIFPTYGPTEKFKFISPYDTLMTIARNMNWFGFFVIGVVPAMFIQRFRHAKILRDLTSWIQRNF